MMHTFVAANTSLAFQGLVGGASSASESSSVSPLATVARMLGGTNSEGPQWTTKVDRDLLNRLTVVSAAAVRFAIAFLGK